MNVKPKNYEWITFYEHIIDITSYTFSKKAIFNRFRANSSSIPKWLNVIRAISNEGYGRIRFFKKVIEHLRSDKDFRAYFEMETTILPKFYVGVIKKDMGYMWKWLPEGAIYHDQHAYLKKQRNSKKLKVVGTG